MRSTVFVLLLYSTLAGGAFSEQVSRPDFHGSTKENRSAPPPRRSGNHPGDLVVTDPREPYLTEFPASSIDLSTYRAPRELLLQYAKYVKDTYDDRYQRIVRALKDGLNKDLPPLDKMDEELDSALPGCSAAELLALAHYSTAAAYPINRNLRGLVAGKVKGEVLSREEQMEILVTASALNCMPKVTKNAERGIAFDDANAYRGFAETYKEGNYVIGKAFASTTDSHEQAMRFSTDLNDPPFPPGRYFVLIKIKNGMGADLSRLSLLGNEKEMLIGAGTRFRVVSAKVERPLFTALNAREPGKPPAQERHDQLVIELEQVPH